jgi:PDZ domain-containing secreted protein
MFAPNRRRLEKIATVIGCMFWPNVSATTSVDDTATPTTGALSAVLAELKPGQRIRIVVKKQSGAKTTSHVTLGTFPGG